jgi:hypothetical protein
MTMEPTTEQLAEWLSIVVMGAKDCPPHPSVLACDVARLAYAAGAEAGFAAGIASMAAAS